MTPTRDLPPRPAWCRALLCAAGWVFVALALLGVALPLLPTTPFVLLAAACFARGSERFHGVLLTSALFGPTLRAWEEDRSIPARVKPTAIVLVVVTIGTSAVFFVDATWARAVMVAVAVAIVTFLARLPVREDDDVATGPVDVVSRSTPADDPPPSASSEERAGPRAPRGPARR